MSQVNRRQPRVFRTDLRSVLLRDPVLNLVMNCAASNDFTPVVRELRELRRKNISLKHRLRAAEDMLRLSSQEADHE